MALARYAEAFADMADLAVWSGIDGTRQALDLARAGGDWFVENIMQARLCFPLVAVGELAEADRVAATCLEQAKANHEHSNQALGYSVRATTALLRGDPESAIVHAGLAERETRRSNYVLADLFSAATLVLAHVSQGDLTAARNVADAWPNLSRSARAAYRAVLAACFDGEPDAAPQGGGKQPGRFTFISAGYYLATIDAALLAGNGQSFADAAPVLERWRADGLEFPLTYPTSVTRVLGELHRRDRRRPNGRSPAARSGWCLRTIRSPTRTGAVPRWPHPHGLQRNAGPRSSDADVGHHDPGRAPRSDPRPCSRIRLGRWRREHRCARRSVAGGHGHRHRRIDGRQPNRR